jgi:hypothetical protein
MNRLILASLVSVVSAMASTPAIAAPAFAKVQMTCSQARATANQTGYVTVEENGMVFDLMVIGLEGVTVPFGHRLVVNAIDNTNCLVGYISDDTEHGK